MEGHGVQIRPLQFLLDTKKKAKLFHRPLYKEYDGVACVEYALKQLNKAYCSWLGFLIIISPHLRFLAPLAGIDPQTWHCSELVSRSLYSVGVSLPKSQLLMTPADVAKLPCWGKCTEL